MAATYTTNSGIKKPEVGTESNTWGASLNTNFDIIDQMVGIVTITLPATGSTGTPNDVAITDGALSDGRNLDINVTDGGDLGGTAYLRLTPNDAEKVCLIKNSLSGSQDLIVFQGTYDSNNDLVIPAGTVAIAVFDGAGAGAVVTGRIVISSFAATILDDANAAAMLATMGITASVAEINYNDITTLGTAEASKAVTADANGDVVFPEEVTVKSVNGTYLAITSTSNACTINCESAVAFGHVLTENTTLTISNPPASGLEYGFSFKIIQDASASGYTFTWPASVQFKGGVEPALSTTANAIDRFSVWTEDGGTSWTAVLVGRAFS